MNKIKYDIELLQECILRDGACLEGEYIKLNSRHNINYICKCGNIDSKAFRDINKCGAFCKKCIYLNTREKVKTTCIKKYGVENPFQSEEIKQKSKVTCIKKYGAEYGSQVEEIKQKIKATCINKYGVENPLKVEEFRQKFKDTCMVKYGVEQPLQLQEFRQKFKDTCIAKYGVEQPLQLEEFRQKFKDTCMAKYGVEYCSKLEEFKQKFKDTCMEKYGVENVSQDSAIAERASKNGYKTKEIITPSGNKIYLQGYEPHAYKILLKTYKEEEILNSRKDVPEIWWIDKEDKRHRYFVDFYIPKDNLIIEVKSTRTYSMDDKKEKIEKTLQASKEAGYNIELWILNNKGEIINKF